MGQETAHFAAHPVTPERWADLVSLFERPGPRGGSPMPASCWCMWWRERAGDAAKNKQAMRATVLNGPAPGLLAYRDEEPVGWVSVAPRTTLGQLLRSRNLRPAGDADDDGVFAVTCFYVDPRAKRSGVARLLLEAAVAWAAESGAHTVEAYPSERGDYMGTAELYESMGFKKARDAAKRTVVQLALD